MMIRILFYLLVLAGVAYGADWLLQRPGHIEVTWAGYHIVTSAAVGFALLVLAAIAIMVIWSLLRFVFGLPSFLALASRQRRREKGYEALSRGLIAASAGDARVANRASLQASKHLRDDPLAMVLRAQAARLSGDGMRTEAAYGELAQREDTRILGLRGLHDEAHRRGDEEAARHFAAEAHQATPLPWSAQTVLDHRAAEGDWERALSTVETSVAAKLVDRATGERQRAVLETAIGLEKQDIAPDAALALARSAMKRAPDLVPAIALAARLLTRRGEIRKAAKLIENAWPRFPHPELARVYLDVRPGDSTTDRLARAQTLMRIASFDPVSRLTVARTALAAKNFAAARDAMAPLITEGKRPTVRACLAMADLEDAEFGDQGQWREWLARASRAPLDPAWIADGIVYDQWEPVSPTSGRLDAFVWQAPADRPGHAMEAMPASRPPRTEIAATAAIPPAFAPDPSPPALDHSPAPLAAPPPGAIAPSAITAAPPPAAITTAPPPSAITTAPPPGVITAAPPPGVITAPLKGTASDMPSAARAVPDSEPKVPSPPAAPLPAPANAPAGRPAKAAKTAKPFMRTVVVAPDDPGVDPPRKPGKAPIAQSEDLTTTG